jgi:hypothetical protein
MIMRRGPWTGWVMAAVCAMAAIASAAQETSVVQPGR